MAGQIGIVRIIAGLRVTRKTQVPGKHLREAHATLRRIGNTGTDPGEARRDVREDVLIRTDVDLVMIEQRQRWGSLVQDDVGIVYQTKSSRLSIRS